MVVVTRTLGSGDGGKHQSRGNYHDHRPPVQTSTNNSEIRVNKKEAVAWRRKSRIKKPAVRQGTVHRHFKVQQVASNKIIQWIICWYFQNNL